MARLWSCGFELQSNVDLMEFQDATPNLGPQISTTVKRAPGTASMRFNPAAGVNSLVEHQLTAGTVIRTFHRFYMRVDALPVANSNIYHIGQSGFFPANVSLRTDGKLILRDTSAGVDLGSPTAFALTLGRWYRIELDYNDVAGTLTPGVSAFKMYVDGALVSDQMCTNINGFSRVRFGTTGTGGTLDWYCDDVAINDTTGTTQNGLPGPGAIVHLYPDAAGDNNLWSTAVGGTAGAANNFTRVNERTPNDATSYNQTVATGTTTIDDFNLQSAASAGIGTADLVTLVAVGLRAGSDNTTAASVVTRLKSQAAGTVAESASTSINVNGWQTHKAAVPRLYQLTSYTDPQTGTAWTPARLDTAQIGYRTNVSQTTVRRISGLWALVEVVPRFALGVANTTMTAQPLGYVKAARPTYELKDDFNDNTIDTAKWPNNFGTVSETGGAARIEINTGYNAYSSAKAYILQNSQLIVKVTPTVVNDGATEAWFQVLIKSSTEGTDLGFEITISNGNLVVFNRTGYFDPEAAYFLYGAASRWLRIRESGGQVFFDGSPDGHTWTNRRTIASPAWIDDGDLEIQLIGHRSNGTTSYADVDTVNVLTPYLTSIGVANSTTTARAVGKKKRRFAGAAATVQTAHALKVIKRRSIGSAGVGNTARGVTPRKTKGLGAAAVGNLAGVLHALRRIPIGSGSQANAGHGLVPRKLDRLGNPARTADQASPQTAKKRASLGSVAQVVAGHAVRAFRTARTGLAAEANSAHEVSLAKLGDVASAEAADTANPVRVRKTRVIGAAATETTTEALRALRRYSVPPAVHEAAGWPVVARARAYLGSAPTGETAHELVHNSTATVGDAATTSSGHELTPRKADRRATPAKESSTARAVVPRKRLTLGTAHQTDAARPPAGSVKLLRLGSSHATQTGSGVEASKWSHLDAAQADDTATPLDANKLTRIDTISYTESAQVVTWKRRANLGRATLADTGRALKPAKTRHLVNGAVADHAAGVAARKTRSLGRGTAQDTGLDVRWSKRLVLGVAREESEAHGVEIPVLNRLLHPADTTDTAHALSARKQRPADRLVPGTTGPGLTPGISGPGLTPGTSGPTLTVYTTSGGS
ncbi:hypothetical protein SEA_KEANU_13 [Streptomyces phage Keanu]|nr:hypothetical protein SEA_KEANU_13 [Streptomyces phage Keanu]